MNNSLLIKINLKKVIEKDSAKQSYYRDTKLPFLDLDDDKWNGVDSDIVILTFWDGDFSRATFYGVYVSQLIYFARILSTMVESMKTWSHEQ